MHIEALDDSSDARGQSFSILNSLLRAIGPARDIHIGEVRPGSIRGNHFHSSRRELIAVVFTDQWSLHWDTGPETAVHVRKFYEPGAVAVRPPLDWSHAVRNDGSESLWIVAISDQPYDRHESDPVLRDAVRRPVVGHERQP
ncbi:polysaccharide biosynthesis C-terminal domain-containing protein [Myceligenerans cantabricum]